MGTTKQKLAAKGKVENLTKVPPLTDGQILENIGYSKAIAKNPKMVFSSKGVKEELAILGFDEQTAKEVVSEILRGKDFVEPRDRLKAADIVFDVLGSYAPEKHLVIEKKLIQLDE